jgi:hypothetical protein
VRIGRQADGWVDVLAGLLDGEHVVVDPPAQLRDGAAVSDTGGEDSRSPDTRSPDSGSPREVAS